MNIDKRVTLQLKSNLQNTINSYNELCKLAYTIQIIDAEKITLELKNVKFIASNLFAVLGCILNDFYENHKEAGALQLSGINSTIIDVIQKNGFCRHLGLEKKLDAYNTVIPYKVFDVNEIDEYERYLTLSLFGRNDLPKMSDDASNSFRDSLLEIFKNVKDHTSSRKIFTCGQYFPKSDILYFTIVDAGETIPYNVRRFHEKHNLLLPENSVEWATLQGNTTLADNTDTPRGIGLSLIKDFVLLNRGYFYIISGTEILEITQNREMCNELEYPFQGTIVTIGFNLNDTAVYSINKEYKPIQF